MASEQEEREAFEKWAMRTFGWPDRAFERREDNGEYKDWSAQIPWLAWLAARRSAAAPAAVKAWEEYQSGNDPEAWGRLVSAMERLNNKLKEQQHD